MPQINISQTRMFIMFMLQMISFICISARAVNFFSSYEIELKTSILHYSSIHHKQMNKM